MTLHTLRLRHFRNFTALDLKFHPQFNFIFGKNAQGKTNLIEAICCLAELKSFRSTNKSDLIQKQAEQARLEATISRNELSWDLSLTLSASERKVELNGKAPPRRQEYFALLPLILFEPRHIYLFRDSPSERRKYMNRALFLMDPGFLNTLNQFEKILTQKNKILKEGLGMDQLAVWNERLATLATEVIGRRRDFFTGINEWLTREYQAISGTKDSFELVYKPSLEFSGAAQIQEILNQRRPEELERREAFLGPHRDDMSAKLGGRDLGTLGSQGENRSAIIAVKTAQLKMYAKKFGRTPLFLLDDVASELDATRRRHLFSYLRDEAAQVFITTTENEIISQDYEAKSSSFLVEAGTVSVLV
jgi:DNA replication and repair protein RecF